MPNQCNPRPAHKRNECEEPKRRKCPPQHCQPQCPVEPKRDQCRPRAAPQEAPPPPPEVAPPPKPVVPPPTGKVKRKKGPFDLTDEQKALVMDNYYPGLIHDAVNQNADFNEVAKRFVTPESAIDGDKTEKGMSLIEAFDTRVKIEQSTLKSLITTTPDKAAAIETAYQPVYGPSPHPVVSDVVLEESVRASVIPVDLQQYVRTHPESDPVRAISCLSRAQKLNDYYKEYRGAQIAANLAPPDKIEQAAIFGAKSFQIENLSAESKSVESNFFKPLELVSYIGITKPN